MIYQMIYTSLPRCLKPGSSGLGVVACTRGMPPDVVRTLSMCSGYSLVFPPHDEQAELNPKSFIHYLYNYAGTQYDVISQVKFAGFDYSGRSNVLAHHLMSEVESRPHCGLGALIKECCDNNLLLNSWSGEPYIIEKSAVWPMVNSTSGVADYWREVAGDAGWAGVLAAQAVLNPEKPLYVVFAPGIDSFRLLSEALSLLPDQLQWQVTFNTYFTRLHGQFSCSWRFCLRDCPALIQAQRSNEVLVLDLAALKHDPLLVFPEAVNFIEAARSGSVVNIKPPAEEAASERKSSCEFNGDDLLAASEINQPTEIVFPQPDTSKTQSGTQISWDDDYLKLESGKKHASAGGMIWIFILLAAAIFLGVYGWFWKGRSESDGRSNTVNAVGAANNGVQSTQNNNLPVALPEKTVDYAEEKTTNPANPVGMPENLSLAETAAVSPENSTVISSSEKGKTEVAAVAKLTGDEILNLRMELLNFLLNRELSRVQLRLPLSEDCKITDLQLNLLPGTVNGVSYDLEREGGRVFVLRKRHNTKLQTLLGFEILAGGLEIKRLQKEEANEKLSVIVQSMKLGDFKYAVNEAIYPAVVNGKIMEEHAWILVPLPKKMMMHLKMLPDYLNSYLISGVPRGIKIAPLQFDNLTFKVDYPDIWNNMDATLKQLNKDLNSLHNEIRRLNEKLTNTEDLPEFEKNSGQEELDAKKEEFNLMQQQIDKINRQKEAWFSEKTFSRLYLMYGANILVEISLNKSDSLNHN